MNCTSCGAPLPPKSNVCRYCETRNETDLRALKARRTGRGASERPCPRCRQPLQSERIALAGPVELDRCTKCHGIFFDPGELEAVLESPGAAGTEIDLERLDAIVREETPGNDYRDVTYVPCPDCGELMHRKSYGARAGVIVDRCTLHGVWLDGGELRRLLEWSKAGGRAHDDRTKERRAAEEARREKEARVFRHARLETQDPRTTFSSPPADDEGLPGLLQALARMVRG